jgi:hypothetical protein
MSRARAIRIFVVTGVLAAASAFGFYAAIQLAPERLEREILSALERATRGPVELDRLRLVVGLPVEVEGDGLRLWDGALTAEHASARIDVVSLLIGRPRLTHLRLSGAHLQVERLPQGEWAPPIFRPRTESEAEPALEPLRIIESTLRLLLSRRFLADTLIVRSSRVTLRHPALDGSDESVQLEFEHVNGRLMHSRLFGDARLFLRTRIASHGSDLGVVEWSGTRGSDAAIDVTMATTALDLRALAPYLRGLRETAHLAGKVDGIAEFTTRERGLGVLQLDLSARGFSASLGEPGVPPVAVDVLSLQTGIAVTPDRLRFEEARLSAGGLDFEIAAALDRPLGEDSQATLALSLVDLSMDPELARSIAGWLPRDARERFLSLAERVRSGHLLRAELRGRTALAGWGDTLAGRLDRLPEGFELGLEVEDFVIQVDEANRLDALAGHLTYREDTLEAKKATAVLNGGPLPELNLSFRGLSRLLASPIERRQMTSGARALVGVTPLWEVLRPGEEESSSPPPHIELYIDELNHPALLWPLSDVAVELQLESGRDGLHMEVRECRWAGVGIDGEVDWTVAPERRIDIRLVASAGGAVDLPPDAQVAEEVPAAEDPAAPKDGQHPWATGRLVVGPVEGARWRHRSLGARFSAVGGELRLEPVSVELDSGGRLVGRIDLDLSQAERVPYDAQLAVLAGDANSLVTLFGAETGSMSGRVDLGARLAGGLVPGRPLLHDASGRIGFEALDGSFRREVPAFVALALASGSFNPFATLDRIRFDRVQSDLALEEGRLSTPAFELDGPDLRLFASGSLDLSERPHALDLEIALFLFRQLDRALELIPLINVLLLGENDNLLAAYFELVGTWDEPVANAKPLRTIEEGPTEVLTRRIPRIITRGVRALGGLFLGSDPEPEPPEESDAAEDAESPAGRPPA